MKQRFLNQKLGKCMSRKLELQRAKLAASGLERRGKPPVPSRNMPAGKPA